jgi:sarcosine oxidase subunit gamma|tara:strand:- start:1680 stop:2261 length:582 start_codon:yes stop_codon:yes gene_type:complete
MSDLFHQQSPIVQIKLTEPKANQPLIREIPFQGFLNLRGRPNNPDFMTAVKKVLGCSLPIEANTVVVSGDYKIYWLGPDEWLVITPTEQQRKVQSELISALGVIFSSVVDNSSGVTIINITGDNAANLIARDCPLDLHSTVFKAGQCAQTRLAKSGAMIAPLLDGSGFELIIRRSFADYLLLWMQDALIEFEA